MGSGCSGSRLWCCFMLMLLGALAGCQVGPAVSVHKLVQRQAALDVSGLAPVESFDPIKVNWAMPMQWIKLQTQKSALYTHQQVRSPSRATGVGVAYVKLPLPLSARTLIWFAKQEYSKKHNDGQILAEWTDAAGRPWFEARNNKYHVRGYAVTNGRSAWIVYCGWRSDLAEQPDEVKLAIRSLETVLPAPLVAKVNERQTASMKSEIRDPKSEMATAS